MSVNDSQNDQQEAEQGEQTEQTGQEQDAPAPTLPSRSRNPLAQDKDFVARPGFRNPSNQRSKAQKSTKSQQSGKRKR